MSGWNSECPKCGGRVEYNDHDYEAPKGNISFSVDCPKCGWEAEMYYDLSYVGYKTTKEPAAPKERYFRFSIEASVGAVCVRAASMDEALARLAVAGEGETIFVKRASWDPEPYDLDENAGEEVCEEEAEMFFPPVLCDCCGFRPATHKDMREEFGTIGRVPVCDSCASLSDQAYRSRKAYYRRHPKGGAPK